MSSPQVCCFFPGSLPVWKKGELWSYIKIVSSQQQNIRLFWFLLLMCKVFTRPLPRNACILKDINFQVHAEIVFCFLLGVKHHFVMFHCFTVFQSMCMVQRLDKAVPQGRHPRTWGHTRTKSSSCARANANARTNVVCWSTRTSAQPHTRLPSHIFII